MMKKLYEIPESELLVVRFEENILSNTGETFDNTGMEGQFTEDGED